MADDLEREPIEELADLFAREHRQGLSPSIEEYAERFPEHASDIRDLFPAMLVMEDLGQCTETRVPATAETLAGWAMPDQFGDYQIIRELGRGGMGVVYEAMQRSLGRRVALKVLPSHAVGDAERRERFELEAQAAARLDHSHIVPIFEVGEHDGFPFFSMKLIEGISLDDKLANGPLPPRAAAEVLVPVCRAIEAAHQRGVLHRDLKPANIMIDLDGSPQVTDFGLAKLFEVGRDVSETNASVGTPSYMAPEQALGKWRQISVRTDVYGLGAILYHCLAARPPFQAAMAIHTMQQVITEEPVPLRQLNSSLDRDLETVCLKCLAKQPAARYASARALAEDLECYLSGQPIKARPLSTFSRSVRWCRRKPMHALSVSLLVITCLVSFAAWMVTEAALGRSEKSHRQTREVVDYFLTTISEEALFDQPGMQPLRRQLLEKAREHYEVFVQERRDDRSLRPELASAYFRLGLVDLLIGKLNAAEKQFQRAREIQSDLVENKRGTEPVVALSKTLTRLGEVSYRQHRFDAASDYYEQAQQLRRELVRLEPANPEYGRLLANATMHAGFVDKSNGNFERARERYVEAEKTRRQLLQEHDNEDIRRDLGIGLFNLGMLEMEAAKQSAEPKFLDAAETAMSDAVGIFRLLVKEQPNDLGHRHKLAKCWRLLADAQARKGVEYAVESYANVLPELEKMAFENPTVVDFQVALAMMEMSLGRAAFVSNRPNDAVGLFDEARKRLELLIRLDGNEAGHRENLAICLRAIGEIEALGANYELARDRLSNAKSIFDSLVNDYPDRKDYQAGSDGCEAALGQIDAITGSKPAE